MSKLPFLSSHKRKIVSDEELKLHCQAVHNYYMGLPFDRKQVKKRENYYRMMFRLFAPLNVLKRTRVIQTELLPPLGTGVIFVCNHIGSYDQFFMSAALGNRAVHYLVNQKVTTWPIRWNLIYGPSGTIVVDQQSLQSWKNAKTKLVQLLLYGHDVFIFPEGTRRGADNLGEFHSGVAQVIQESGSKTVTLAIKNTARLLTTQHPIVYVGKTLQFEARETTRAITKSIQDSVYDNYEKIKIYERNLKEHIL